MNKENLTKKQKQEIVTVAKEMKNLHEQMGCGETNLKRIVQEIMSGMVRVESKQETKQNKKETVKMQDEKIQTWEETFEENKNLHPVTKVNDASGSVDFPEMEPAKSGMFFKRSEKTHYLRFYTFDHNGKKEIVVKKKLHWDSGKAFPCSGEGCARCENDSPSVKYSVNVVDRKVQPQKCVIWDMPATLASVLRVYHQENGDGIYGNSGKTFRVDYDEAKKKWSMMPVDKDKEVLSIDKVYDLLADRSK